MSEDCINRYLWSIYERTPKTDTVKLEQRIKSKIKKNGKTRTVTKTVTSFANEEFAWKDVGASQKVAMTLPDYVIGGMDKGFKAKLFRLIRAMDDAGLEPGITSAFRDDYRQSIASGKKAATDNSYHGGSRHGGYGHGLAADLVSVKGPTRADRMISSEDLWKWIDAHEIQFGVGRPYLDRDPPHVAPTDGKEYVYHRGNKSIGVAKQQPGTKKEEAVTEKKDAGTPQQEGVVAKTDFAIATKHAVAAKKEAVVAKKEIGPARKEGGTAKKEGGVAKKEAQPDASVKRTPPAKHWRTGRESRAKA
jgi:hypothetical protein